MDNTAETIELEENICCECNASDNLQEITIGRNSDFYCQSCISELFFKCESCDEYFRHGDGREHNGECFCEQCFDESHSFCEHCECYVDNDDITWIENLEASICDHCLDSDFYRCEDCGDYTRENYGGSSLTLCQRCYENNYFNCDGCGEVYHADDMFSGDNGCYCSGCYDEIENAVIHRYHSWNGGKVFHCVGNKKHNQMYYGIELEVENTDDKVPEQIYSEYSSDEDLFHLEHDGSLSNGNSFEIISQPCSIEYHREKFPWEKLLEYLSQSHCKSHNTSTCGLHIHLTKKHLSYTQQIKLGMFVNLHLSQMQKVARRKCNNYCKPKRVYNEDGKFVKPDDNPDRYEFVNYTNERTIEIRGFKGTLKYESFMASLEFVNSLVEYVKVRNVQQIVNGSWDDFSEFAKSLKDNKFLKDYFNNKNL